MHHRRRNSSNKHLIISNRDAAKYTDDTQRWIAPLYMYRYTTTQHGSTPDYTLQTERGERRWHRASDRFAAAPLTSTQPRLDGGRPDSPEWGGDAEQSRTQPTAAPPTRGAGARAGTTQQQRRLRSWRRQQTSVRNHHIIHRIRLPGVAERVALSGWRSLRPASGRSRADSPGAEAAAAAVRALTGQRRRWSGAGGSAGTQTRQTVGGHRAGGARAVGR